MRDALALDFERGLARIARTEASQITPEVVEEARQGGEESGGYLALQVQLATLRSATGIAGASVIDASRLTLVDALGPETTERLRSPLDSLAAGALTQAFRGREIVSGAYVARAAVRRAAFAPVLGPNRVVAVVAVEAEPLYLAPLRSLGRRLALIALSSVAAIAGLAVLLVRNATAAARLERRLARAENLAVMGRLTATLAHEIKNPLAIIRGSAERLRSGGGDDPGRRMAQFVIEETDRLSRTVARYLQFARGDETPSETGDACAALDGTLALLEGELAARRVALERSRSGLESATVRLDPESLKQMFLNLLLNAVEALPEGGHVRVDDRVTPDRVEIEIADDGPGIPAEVLNRLGNPFVTTKAQGSGLGLFLSRRLARSAGGDLIVRSDGRHGTVCTVRLPLV